MPRKVRMHFSGALYHCFARGNNKEDIFMDESDKNKYLNLIKKYKDIFDFKIYAYALMNNHIHLLIQVKEDPLSKIMQGIQQSYTQYINKKYKRVGHVFQQRYKANLCNTDEYLLNLIKYIHFNPVQAGYNDGIDYKWSSHREMISNQPPLIDRGELFGFIGDNFIQSIKVYLDLMEKPYGNLDDEYKEAYINLVKMRKEDINQGNELATLDFDSVIQKIIELNNITKDELRFFTKREANARRLIVLLCIKHKIVERKQLSSFLGVGGSAISKLYYEAMRDEKIRGQATLIHSVD